MPSMRPLRQQRRQTQMYTVKSAPMKISSVWADNLESEFALIRAAVATHPHAVIDTEFPGTIYIPTKHHLTLSPDERYAILKANVDDLSLIQLGLTLSDAHGHRLVWEFNFRDFDVRRDPHNVSSITLLREHGLDFEKSRTKGIDSSKFAQLLATSGLICNGSGVSWVAFSGSYDFAYLIKTLIRQKLPETMSGFLRLVSFFFGMKVFDMKHLMKFSSVKLIGGLERVAAELEVVRTAGCSHQAGSDSLLTAQAFQKMKGLLVPKSAWQHKQNGVLCGLQKIALDTKYGQNGVFKLRSTRWKLGSCIEEEGTREEPRRSKAFEVAKHMKMFKSKKT